MSEPLFALNGRSYQRPARPVVVVCIDGGDPSYLEHGMRKGFLPTISRFVKHGFFATARAVVPTYTNPNNVSIVTGGPPSVHGIVGNYVLDRASGKEVMTNDPSFLRCETLLAAFSRRGVRTAMITGKDKLRRLLGHGMSGICFSSERAAECTLVENGIERVPEWLGLPPPEVYSAELSLFVLEAGIKLLQDYPPDVMYLTLSDYVQHKHAPGTAGGDAFFRAVDDALRRLAAAGGLVAVTADHGMNDKATARGEPNVIYLQDRLDDRFGPEAAKVILPIIDPYIVHHGSLGSFARIYCSEHRGAEAVMTFVSSLAGIELVVDRKEACRRFESLFELEADVVVVSDARTAIGLSPDQHDLSALGKDRLRSHGGIAEQPVPFILSQPLNPAYARKATERPLRNFDIFDFAINGT